MEPAAQEIRRELAALRAAFRDRFGRAPTQVAVAPGRVNLIGGHTDYNEGFVLPVALDRVTRVALAPREDRRVRIATLDLDDATSFELDALGPPRTRRDWIAYPRGVLWALRRAGVNLRGFDAMIESSVPPGAGLSSSAALELALMRGVAQLVQWPWDPLAAAGLCRRAEVEFVGVECGPMDQLCAAVGRAGHALFIDCRALSVQPVQLPAQVAVVVLDTGTRRRLEGSEFNARRQACAETAERLGVAALRDVDDLGAALTGLPADLRPLVRHVVEENARTWQAAQALRRGDVAALGALLRASHRSLRDHYRVSAPALDRMVAQAQAQPGCWGARLTGAGFAGCVVALVEAGVVEDFAERTVAGYGEGARAYVVRAGDGAGIVDP